MFKCLSDGDQPAGTAAGRTYEKYACHRNLQLSGSVSGLQTGTLRFLMVWFICLMKPGSRDTCVLETPEEEGIYLATLDLSMLRSSTARKNVPVPGVIRKNLGF